MQINFIKKICNWQLFSWNLMLQNKQHQFCTSRLPMLHLQSSIGSVNFHTAQHWIRVTSLSLCTAAPATLSIIKQLPDAWHTMWYTHFLHIHKNWNWYHNWPIHPDLIDSTSASILGCEGLCWVRAYHHKDKKQRAWLPQGCCCCKMYFLENNDFQFNVPS